MNGENFNLAWQLLPIELWHTVYMVLASSFFALVIGLPIGIILTITSQGHIKENPVVYKILEMIVNVGRSFPFAILMVALIPLTRAIMGTSLGTSASIVPLTIAAAPFLAKLIENNLKEVSKETLEAVSVIGSNSWQIITKVLIPETLPSIVSSTTVTVINVVGYSAMAGLVGGGGLGQVAIQYGYHRFNTPIMIATVVLLILLVECFQFVGGSITKHILKKRGR